MQVFVSDAPGVREGVLKPAWEGRIDLKQYPRFMFHPALGMVIVRSRREERALGPEWSRSPLPRSWSPRGQLRN